MQIRVPTRAWNVIPIHQHTGIGCDITIFNLLIKFLACVQPLSLSVGRLDSCARKHN